MDNALLIKIGGSVCYGLGITGWKPDGCFDMAGLANIGLATTALSVVVAIFIAWRRFL